MELSTEMIPFHPCWEFTGADNGHGYRTIGYKGRNEYAHRIAWIMANGPIPDGLEVCHSCDNRSCVRPSHLFLGTRLDNMRDMKAKGRGLHKEKCRRGHPYTPENILPAGYGRGHKCLTCRRISDRKYMAKYRAAHRERELARLREYHRKNRERLNEKRRERRRRGDEARGIHEYRVSQ